MALELLHASPLGSGMVESGQGGLPDKAVVATLLDPMKLFWNIDLVDSIFSMS